MSTFTVKESTDKKRPGYVIECVFLSLIHNVNDKVFETKEDAFAYCDRLNKLFGTNLQEGRAAD